MGDRMRGFKGKAKEVKGGSQARRRCGHGRPGTEARGAGEEMEGKAENTIGKARSAVKKNTR